MKRKDFLKRVGLAGAASIVSLRGANAAENAQKSLLPPPVCTVVPSETSGPYPLSLCGTATYWRTTIHENKEGVLHNVTLTVIGAVNCLPMVGARVDFWHCSAEGYYSGYTTNGHNGSQNNGTARWFRGIATTNAAGQVTFVTKFPGWYSGRTCHIHFEVFTGGTVGSCTGWTSKKISQLGYPNAEKNALLVANAPYSTWGADPINIQNDGVFSDGYSLQLATLTGSAGGPYNSALEFAINASGTLPLEIIGIGAALKGQNALIWWRSTAEKNFSHFEVQYSADAEDYETVGRVVAKGQTGDDVNDYSFEDTDRLIYGNAYYRLKMVDFDGVEEFSSMVVVTNNHEKPIRIHPNPAIDHVMLSHPQTNGGEKIMLLDALCRPIGSGEIPEGSEVTRIDLGLCKTGINYLVFFDGNDSQVLKFFVN